MGFLVDSGVFEDFLNSDKNINQKAKKVIDFIKKNNEGYITEETLNSIHRIAENCLEPGKAERFVGLIEKNVLILKITNSIRQRSYHFLEHDVSNEAAVILACAIEKNFDAIITSNTRKKVYKSILLRIKKAESNHRLIVLSTSDFVSVIKFCITLRKNFKIILMFFLILIIFLLLVGKFLVIPNQSQEIRNSCAKEQHSFGVEISLGEKTLVRQDTYPDKEAGVKAFASGDCGGAMDKFKLSLKVNRNDPEALIYLNNAKARQQVGRLTIGVSVPIGSNSDVAKEILRGVAQAQDELNRRGGINGKLFQVVIANDDNNPFKGVQRADEFGKDSSILAVIGHNASEVSIAAASTYNQYGLVMISPTSYSKNFDGFSSFFRTAPSVSLLADRLSNYAIKTASKTNFLICIDSKTIDGKAFDEEFSKRIEAAGGKINSTNCGLSVKSLKADAIISQAISSGANALLLYPHVDRIDDAISFAKAAHQRRLAILGNPSLYTYKTLDKGKTNFNGMVLPTLWHPEAFPDHPFSKSAQQLWGGDVTWRTATAYDATLAIAKGLQQSENRIELQKVLHSSNFFVNGATGKIQFSSSGDRRDNTIFLVQVQQKSGIKTGYKFGLLHLTAEP